MTLLETTKIPIKTEADLLHARRLSREFAQKNDIGEQAEIKLATIVSELCRNILKYAGSGECELTLLREKHVRCIFRDQGPGISDLKSAMTDGFSTSGTLGIGLPGTKRLADKFDIQSDTSGTEIAIELSAPAEKESTSYHNTHADSSDSIRLGIAVRPYANGRFSGDQASVWHNKRNVLITLIDGLGHGKNAEIAAKKAIDIISDNQDMDLVELMQKCDKALYKSRGAALALVRIDRSSGKMEYVSIGNTRCAIVGQNILHLGGRYGIVGEGGPIASVERRQLERRDVLILWTDGLPETLGLVAPQVRRIQDAKAFANQLVKEYATDEDDAGVVVYRWDV